MTNQQPGQPNQPDQQPDHSNRPEAVPPFFVHPPQPRPVPQFPTSPIATGPTMPTAPTTMPTAPTAMPTGPTAMLAGPARKRRGAVPWLAGGVAAVVLLCCGISVAAGLGADPDRAPAAGSPSAAGTPATPSPKTSSAAPVVTTAPTTRATTTTPPPPTKPRPAPKPTYRALTARQWKLIAKSPDSYIGKTYVVFGVVTQFDSATGDDTFRADVAHRNLAYDFEYDTNTLLTGTTGQLKNLVQDDEFRANVTVLGSYSYDTQIGGNTTVPLLRIDSIKLL